MEAQDGIAEPVRRVAKAPSAHEVGSRALGKREAAMRANGRDGAAAPRPCISGEVIVREERGDAQRRSASPVVTRRSWTGNRIMEMERASSPRSGRLGCAPRQGHGLVEASTTDRQSPAASVSVGDAERQTGYLVQGTEGAVGHEASRTLSSPCAPGKRRSAGGDARPSPVGRRPNLALPRIPLAGSLQNEYA